jgi:hypothetical protein
MNRWGRYCYCTESNLEQGFRLLPQRLDQGEIKGFSACLEKCPDYCSHIITPTGGEIVEGLNFGSQLIDNRPKVQPDFNKDGFADMVWRHRLTGANTLWLMNSTTRDEDIALPTMAPDWELRTLADVDNNGTSDLIWQHKSSGQVSLWLMEETNRLNSVTLPGLNAAWKMVAAADFDGDGQVDIFWRHSTLGQNVVWLMDGTSQKSTVNLAAVGSDWEVGAVGDFNTDSHVDIFWQMDGFSFESAVTTLPALNPNWTAVV